LPKEDVTVLKDGGKVAPEDFKEAFTKTEDGTEVTTATLLCNESIKEIVEDIFKEV